ncbi:hypothetical protein TNCV_3470331 [Trichonephila clavipes]|nr:hypothetical protein TNCV_3470331 [Trichonephila clavipes]
MYAHILLGIHLLPRSVYSPDISSVENEWDLVSRLLARDPRPTALKHELWQHPGRSLQKYNAGLHAVRIAMNSLTACQTLTLLARCLSNRACLRYDEKLTASNKEPSSPGPTIGEDLSRNIAGDDHQFALSLYCTVSGRFHPG